nr:hypothetical protein [Rhodobacter calidifons]
MFEGCGSAVLARGFPEPGIGFAPIAIGLALTLVHLISIPVTNSSVACHCGQTRHLS